MTTTKNNTIASVLRAAGHPVRVNILELLKEDGETSVNDICEKLKIEQSLTSHHLSLLSKAGYIKGNRKGKFIFYSISNKELYGLLETVKKELKLN
jgi:ArsR family transcriptional regulator